MINNNQFYPTPAWLADKMLRGVQWESVSTVLEPEAGKGDIALAVKESAKSVWRYDKIDIDCIEIDPNLRHILKGKDLRVVHDDFLTYHTAKEYDLIVMNPPFKDGAKHLLKAIELQKRNGGSVICLLNAETIRNPFTNERKVLVQKLNDYDAHIEYISDAFIDAEISANVDVALIILTLPEVERQSVIIDRLRQTETYEDLNVDTNNLVDSDFLKAIVQQYQFELQAGINLINEYKAISPYIMQMFDNDESAAHLRNEPMLSLSITNVNEYVARVRGKYWRALFKNKEFTGQLTSNLSQQYYNQIDELKNYDFSLYNIYEIKLQMLNSMSIAVEETIVALFDELSYQHSYYPEYSKNIHYFNGWATNKAHIINKKVIIPLNGFDNWFNRYRPTQYDVMQKLNDIEKSLDYLDCGRAYPIRLGNALECAEKAGITKNIELKHFTVTFYKKGTCHITFKSDELLKKFNLFGCQRKGWLPPAYGKKAYNDMTAEEKTVVDEFEGKESYTDTFANSDYYICAPDASASLLSA